MLFKNRKFHRIFNFRKQRKEMFLKTNKLFETKYNFTKYQMLLYVEMSVSQSFLTDFF